MAEYELVREIPNLCRNNQMRDIFFEEVETEDPVAYVRRLLEKGIESPMDEHTEAVVYKPFGVAGCFSSYVA